MAMPLRQLGWETSGNVLFNKAFQFLENVNKPRCYVHCDIIFWFTQFVLFIYFTPSLCLLTPWDGGYLSWPDLYRPVCRLAW